MSCYQVSNFLVILTSLTLTFFKEMIERMTALLPVERQQLSRNIVPRRDNFEVLYHLHFDNLCADFQVSFSCSVGECLMIKAWFEHQNTVGI